MKSWFYVYNCLLKKWVNGWHFSQFYFFNGLMLFFTWSNGGYFQWHIICEKNDIVKQWLTVVKYSKIAKIHT